MHDSASAVAPKQAGEVRILDDDEQVLEYLVRVVTSLGYEARGYREPHELFAAPCDEPPACLLVDWQLQGHDGLDVIAQCRRQWPASPALLVSGHVTVPVTVDAMRQGAAGVLEKPIKPQDLARELSLALAKARDRTTAEAERSDARQKIETLGELELSVLRLLVEGTPNKNIATQTGMAIRTVEKYRRMVFDKLGVDSAAEATRVWVLAHLEI